MHFQAVNSAFSVVIKLPTFRLQIESSYNYYWKKKPNKICLASSVERVLEKGKFCILLLMLSKCIVLASTVLQLDLKIVLLKHFKCHCAFCLSFIIQLQSFWSIYCLSLWGLITYHLTCLYGLWDTDSLITCSTVVFNIFFTVCGGQAFFLLCFPILYQYLKPL